MSELHTSPMILALLHFAKDHPEDEAVRFALADALEEAGEPHRAEFLRVQLALGSGSPPPSEGERLRLRERSEELLGRYGGAWLGPLWQHGGTWHRGLLAVELDRQRQPAGLDVMFPWIDSLLLEVPGHDALRWAVSLAVQSGANHVTLRLRRPFTAAHLLGPLGAAPAAPQLRTLTFRWSPGMGVRTEQGVFSGLRDDFFARLAALPLAQGLTHLGSSFRLTDGQARSVGAASVEPVFTALSPHWPHSLPPSAFAR